MATEPTKVGATEEEDPLATPYEAAIFLTKVMRGELTPKTGHEKAHQFKCYAAQGVIGYWQAHELHNINELLGHIITVVPEDEMHPGDETFPGREE